MVDIIQALGVAYLLLMLYMTFLYYKRNNYSWRSFVFWMAVWSGGILLLLFPESLTRLTQRMHIARVLDFYMILGLMFFSIVCFFSYAKVKRNEAKVEELVRASALERAKGEGKRDEAAARATARKRRK